MNRRGFLGLIAAAAPAMLILSELLVPKRTFFLPPAGGWAQRHLTDIWLDYANLVWPVGVAVNVVRLSTIQKIRVVETLPWVATPELPFEIDAMTEWRMRRAMLNPPTYRFGGTLAELKPWEKA